MSLRRKLYSVQIEPLSNAEFDAIVEAALEELPEQVRNLLDNIVIFVADEYEPLPDEEPQPELLGLYEGVPLDERGDDPLGMPDHLTIFKNPLERMVSSYEELARQIRITVMHEIAHYFGISDEQLHAWGWG
ncbi:metallopeptidase family protein [Auritidibacter ignavus]|uniref:Metallopeptidase family protein n=2 Tax=Auritidibacter ignavus TaxID=678932 RepID=A0AAJ6ALK5_9MICC|nr:MULTISPECIES: metallopeptidase family protein [Auritidibacter]PXA81733.1 hypothetical protein DCC26_01860 [Auritidibacter sp. NML120779]PXA79163.1 hypothetical protein DCC25_09855 [Auritidibacter sp. NML120636]RMX21920.1 metallopeptidase family protein [Auritidibacter ignavus]WGH80799.1 metallopeptidase family protein [Auritidibacter ignavus]WGH85877.1 metallopeptidase family protein [Auritidibacter ignavus]